MTVLGMINALMVFIISKALAGQSAEEVCAGEAFKKSPQIGKCELPAPGLPGFNNELKKNLLLSSLRERVTMRLRYRAEALAQNPTQAAQAQQLREKASEIERLDLNSFPAKSLIYFEPLIGQQMRRDPSFCSSYFEIKAELRQYESNRAQVAVLLGAAGPAICLVAATGSFGSLLLPCLAGVAAANVALNLGGAHDSQKILNVLNTGSEISQSAAIPKQQMTAERNGYLIGAGINLALAPMAGAGSLRSPAIQSGIKTAYQYQPLTKGGAEQIINVKGGRNQYNAAVDFISQTAFPSVPKKIDDIRTVLEAIRRKNQIPDEVMRRFNLTEKASEWDFREIWIGRDVHFIGNLGHAIKVDGATGQVFKGFAPNYLPSDPIWNGQLIKLRELGHPVVRISN